MTTRYKMVSAAQGWPGGVDLDDLYVRKEYFFEGGLWTWGNNYNGALGTNSEIGKSSPVQTVTGGNDWRSVACGKYGVAALQSDGSLWTWGDNTYGQLGDNTLLAKSSPVQTVALGANWRSVACGGTHTAAVKTDGSLWLWGQGNTGQLGQSSTASRSSPVQTVALGANWKAVDCGNLHTVAVKTDGTLWVWGDNAAGQLGDNDASVVARSSPVQTVALGTVWKQVACGQYLVAAVKTDGSLWLWGDNGDGQLGDNTRTHRSSPVQTVAAGTDWRSVACSRGDIYNHTAAIKTDGTLWLWGYGAQGELGDNTNLAKSSPVQTVAAGTNWKSAACSGTYSTAAVKTDGSLWTWGNGSAGVLGDNATTARSSPVQTVAGGTNWRSAACGYNILCALRDFWA